MDENKEDKKYRYFCWFAVTIPPLLIGYAAALKLNKPVGIPVARFQSSQSSELNSLRATAFAEPSFDRFFQLAFALHQKGFFEDSIIADYAALSFDPRSAVVWSNICSSFNMLKRPKEAVQACDKALEIDPNLTLAQNNRAWAFTLNAEPPPQPEEKR